MTSEKRLTSISKFLSKYLRHAPQDLGLHLLPGGYVYVDQLLAACSLKGFVISYDELIECVAADEKTRYSFDGTGDLIRANQGHSVEVDLQLKEIVPPDVLYHGTVERFMGPITATGLQKMNRHHVHLSEKIETAKVVGMRRGSELTTVILKIDSKQMHEKGIKFYQSENGVWLTDSVPSEFIQRW